MLLIVLKAILAAAALVLAIATVRSVVSGQVAWHSPSMAARRESRPFSFWVLLAMNTLTVGCLIWLALP